jgi:hypothetical protein
MDIKKTPLEKTITILKEKNNADDKIRVLKPFADTLSHLTLIVGPPGSGKTTTLKSMLTDKNVYGKKYHMINVISPSIRPEYLPLINGRVYNEVNSDTVNTAIDNIVNFANARDEYELPTFALIVFDDVQSYYNDIAKQLETLVNNRRHIIKNGGLGVIIIGQTYAQIPLRVRKLSNVLIAFTGGNLNHRELNIIREEMVPYVHRHEFTALMKYINSIPHNSMTINNQRIYSGFSEEIHI